MFMAERDLWVSRQMVRAKEFQGNIFSIVRKEGANQKAQKDSKDFRDSKDNRAKTSTPLTSLRPLRPPLPSSTRGTTGRFSASAQEKI